MDTPDNQAAARCPHMGDCEMYEMFELVGTLAIWQLRYCTGSFTTCERYCRTERGEAVPRNLLPNGRVLQKQETGR